jgi:hypothetical protein
MLLVAGGAGAAAGGWRKDWGWLERAAGGWRDWGWLERGCWWLGGLGLHGWKGLLVAGEGCWELLVAGEGTGAGWKGLLVAGGLGWATAGRGAARWLSLLQRLQM